MEKNWNPTDIMKEVLPDETSIYESILTVAENAGPFATEAVMDKLAGSILSVVHQAVPTQCERSECTLRNTKEWSAAGSLQDSHAMRIVTHDGSPRAKAMFIGEAPGVGEWNTFKPLVGIDQVLQSKCIMCDLFEDCFSTILPKGWKNE